MVERQDSYVDKIARIALVAAIIAWTFQLVSPLLGVLAWGFILAVIFYPFFIVLNSLLRNSPIVSATIICLCLILLLSSMTFFIASDTAKTINEFAAQLSSNGKINPPPESIQSWPLVGKRLYEFWLAAATNFEDVVKQHSEMLLDVGKFGLKKLLYTSKDFLFFVISIFFAGYLMVNANNIMFAIKKFADRVVKKNSAHLLTMIRDTIQNVSRGVIGISLLQTFIFWLLLVIAGVSAAGILSLLALLISIAQIGLFFLVIPIIAWLFFTKSFVFALIIAIFLIFDALLDSFLKPFIMARGLSTPVMIIFIGVIGGILTYGMIGVFLGPVVLAVAYDLFRQWV